MGPGLVCLLAGALLVWLLAPTVLRRLPWPEPDELAAADEADPAHRGFAPLDGPGFRAALALGLGLAAVIAGGSARPLAWAGLATAGVLAGFIDARSRYLPLRLMHGCWAGTVLGVAAECARRSELAPAGRALAGAAALGAVFALLWRLGGLAFGDVRLALAIGGAAAAGGWASLFWALLLGSAAGAAWGVVARLVTSQRSFAYGPGLLLGVFGALLVPG